MKNIVGNDQIVHVAGAVKKQSLSQINSNGVHTFRAWGGQGGVPLKQPGEGSIAATDEDEPVRRALFFT